MQKVLTIAGSDCSGGAGIQADIKTMTVHKVYAMSVITSVTSQNTTNVFGVFDVSPEFVGSQMDSVFTDIYPDAVKIGMVSNKEIIEVIASKLKEYDAKNIVVDPVMISTSGKSLLSEDAMEALINKLLPMATLITPNILEAEVIWGNKIENEEDMVEAAIYLKEKTGANVLIKGGHNTKNANDLLYTGEISWFAGRRINNKNTHGTGCTLSSAIASNIALGYDIKESIGNAKRYITRALEVKLDLGKGSGPLDHMFCVKEAFNPFQED